MIAVFLNQSHAFQDMGESQETRKIREVLVQSRWNLFCP